MIRQHRVKLDQNNAKQNQKSGLSSPLALVEALTVGI
jgi:hypothetical protein